MRFWDTKEGKIIAHGMHDHTNALLGLKYMLSKDMTRERVEKAHELIKRIEKSMDYIYSKMKEIHEERELLKESKEP